MIRVALIIPTRNGERNLSRLFVSLADQTLACDVFVIDSSSSDHTCEVAVENGAVVKSIAMSEFNHGGTRQMMVEAHPDYDLYIFLTQDVYPADERALEHLVAPFTDLEVGAACGRQLPHLDATPIAEHARLFNYPEESRIKSMADTPDLSIKTPFMSNSFAAYRRDALSEVGGFPRHVILCEDMYVAARMLLAGWKVAYMGNACCHHSHNYTMIEEFRRYFDLGVFHARESWIRASFGGASDEALRYVQSELLFLGLKRIHLWPSSLLRDVIKFVAYKLGQQERKIPFQIKQHLSMHRRFWNAVNS